MNKLYIIFLSILLTLGVHAQRITVQGPTQIPAGQQFQLRYVVNTTDVKGFRIGKMPDAFEVIYGPSTSTQQSFSMVNGHTTQSSSVTYTYVLMANKNGSYVIPAAHAVVAGSNVSSQALRIKVSGHATSANQSTGGQQQHPARVQTAGSNISDNDLFIRVTANKQRVHEQEPVLLTYKVYTQVELTQLEGKMPDLNGFHTQEIPLPQQKTLHVETVNGRQYNCTTWSQYMMYPQMSGKLVIPSLAFKGIVMQQNPNVDPFEAFFNGGSGYTEVKKIIHAPSVTIQVDPLPTKPSNFSGGVGTFSISSSVDKNSVKAGDPVSLRIVVSGTGNIKLIKQPEVTLPKDFDKYDPKVTDNTKLTAAGVTGSMIYDILIVPRNKGEYTIPPIEFVYFDTNSSAYMTAKTAPISLTVEQGKGGGGAMADYSQHNNDISDIISGNATHEHPSDSIFGTTAYIIANSLILLAFIILLVIFRKRALALADVTATRGRKANKTAVKRLKKAASLMSSNKQEAFYDEVLRALWGYVGDKLNIHVEQLSRDNIADRLHSRNVDASVVTSFIEAIDECEFARYAPSSATRDASTKMQHTYDKAATAITNIEDAMRTKKNTASPTATAIVAMLLIGTMSADATENLKAKADAAYRSDDYQTAMALYTDDLREGVSAETYNNLGNTYYRMDETSKAIISYERALKLAPGNGDIQHSIEIARKKTIDRMPAEPEIFFVEWFRGMTGWFSINTWSYIAIISFIASLLLFLAYLFMHNMQIRRGAFYTSVVFLALTVLGNVSAWQRKSFLTTHDTAVIMTATVNVKSAPTPSATDVGQIHEGTTIRITDRDINGWYGIRLSDGREGWIKTGEAEEI